ncbi:hypothetical protein [Micromonospora purpureochromogenes]|uniref:hypothetical protein n=1 Tax=Micromonospora purpureochromogenes TaxID=47872 RepID=UPI0012FD7259|nr:hypothetical protein [Micromonospora purpureochromogenes]
MVLFNPSLDHQLGRAGTETAQIDQDRLNETAGAVEVRPGSLRNGGEGGVVQGLTEGGIRAGEPGQPVGEQPARRAGAADAGHHAGGAGARSRVAARAKRRNGTARKITCHSTQLAALSTGGGMRGR